MLEIAKEEDDDNFLNSVIEDTILLESLVDSMELKSLLIEKNDANSAYIDIHPGSGGVDAQDCADILFRMYVKWGEKNGFSVTTTNYTPGEGGGIKNATIYVAGDYAFGWLKGESGIHRFVRKSPFDSGNRRHTSFVSVFLYPELEKKDEVLINTRDLKIYTYKASGSGGQHVNTTNSAVRITHEPTGIIVQYQGERSQHKNKLQAMKQLKAKLYKFYYQKEQKEKSLLEDKKLCIEWGNQIRSYVFDKSRIKDLRTGIETSNIQSVLDGDIKIFIESYLKNELKNNTENCIKLD